MIDGRLRALDGGKSWLLGLVDLESHHLVLFSGVGLDVATGAALRHAREAFSG